MMRRRANGGSLSPMACWRRASPFGFWVFSFSGRAPLSLNIRASGLAFFTIIFLHKFRRKIGKFFPIAAVKIHPVRRTIALLKRPSRAMMALVVVLVLLFLGRLEL